jgi:hypothetical protein
MTRSTARDSIAQGALPYRLRRKIPHPSAEHGAKPDTEHTRMGHLADAHVLPIDIGYAQEERGITDTGLYEEKKPAKRS